MPADKESQVHYISQRLSLRRPQVESLRILADLDERLAFHKGQDVAAALELVKAAYPSVQDFEREFPSLCFALATGVGKTRLMGALIAYLHRTGRSHHFFILAPNLTIYDKLIRDFTPGSPLYVFTGLDVFANHPPIVVTGENYQEGAGIRQEGTLPGVVRADEAHINIFNISKINSESRGGKEPRIKRLSEYIGQSYFEYLAALPDLVLLMDESHRYRADAGMRAINELKPILGLEMTATPKVERGNKTEHFRNVVYNYPLAKAIDDGFVKSPAVLTRKDFKAENYNPAELERLKLEDGLRLHEAVKVRLELYAREEDKPLVKPFVLVVARDIEHAKGLEALIESADFFNGAYQGKAITVHSNQSGSENDDVVAKLLSVEDPKNPVEVVIHVNMLKEGWDVRNLYTIVPLRAANATVLVEQTIGRGLRLPFGRRTLVPELDRLTIVAHDNFQRIVDEARKPGSAIQIEEIQVNDDADLAKPGLTVSAPLVLSQLGQAKDAPPPPGDLFQPVMEGPVETAAAEAVLAEIKFGRVASLEAWREPERMRSLVQAAERAITPAQGELDGVAPVRPDYGATVRKVVDHLVANLIQIPRVIVGLKPDSQGHYVDFDLDLGAFPPLQAQPHDILIQRLREGDQVYLNAMGDGVVKEKAPENYILRRLDEFNQINYDRDKGILNRLAGQVVAHYRALLKSEDDLHNVLLYQGRFLASKLAEQLDAHFEEPKAEFEVTVVRGYTVPEPTTYENDRDGVLPLRAGVSPLSAVPKKVFGGLKKCLYPFQKFDSNPERVLAIVLENDAQVLKWVRPAKDLLRIHVSGGDYRPDFVVETDQAKWVVEVKARNEMDDPLVLEKAEAARRWCAAASTADPQAKAWRYVLVADDDVRENSTFQGLAGMP